MTFKTGCMWHELSVISFFFTVSEWNSTRNNNEGSANGMQYMQGWRNWRNNWNGISETQPTKNT